MSTFGASESPVPIELTFDLCPVFQVSSSKTGYPNEYSFSRSVDLPLEETTETFDQSWVIRAAAGVGLPRGIDQDVYMAIVALLHRAGGMPTDCTLYFTLYELLEILGWHSGGGMRRRLKQSLERTASTTISATNAFWSTQNQTLVSKTFKPFSVSFGHYSNPQSGLIEKHRLAFDQFFAEHWSNTHDTGINLPFYWRLEGHVARRLYRLIDLQAARPGKSGTRSWQVRLDVLRDLVPLAHYRYASLIKDKLRGAHEQLIEQGYLSEYTYYSPEGKRGPTFVRYEVSPSFDKHRAVDTIERDPARALAIQRMLAVTANFDRQNRMSRRQAVKLSHEYGADRCLHYAELFPFQKPHGAGLLVSAIKNGYDWERPAIRAADSRSPGSAGSGSLPPGSGGSSDDTTTGSQSSINADTADNAKSPHPDKHETVENSGSVAQEAEPDDRQSTEPETYTAGERVPASKAVADKFYQQILSELSDEDGVLTVSEWFESVYARALDDGVLTLVTPNEAARYYLGKRFKKGMEGHLSELLSSAGYTGDVEVRLVVSGEGG